MSVFRFAPSPNGELHLGHAYSALLNAELAGMMGGRLLLRIEDIDTARCTPEFEAGIYRDLEWLGIAWERPVRRQSEHFADYAAALERLKRMGLIYPAFMSRGEVRSWIAEFEAAGETWLRDPDGAPHYPPADKLLAEDERNARMAGGQPFAWRLDMERAITLVSPAPPPLTPPLKGEGVVTFSEPPSPLRGGVRGGGGLSWKEFAPSTSDVTAIEAHPERWGDVILARSDIPTSYHLSVVVDDALQGVTHVVRGRDLYEATSVQRLLQTLLVLPEPRYHHHQLILDAEGRKLSKSEKATGLRQLRETGATPADIRAMLGLLRG